MFKLLCFLLILPLACGGGAYGEEKAMDVFYDGQKVELTKAQTAQLDKLIEEAFKDARQMPALGVSLHDKTLEAREKGIWVEYKFTETKTSWELPFESLLFEIQKDCYGVNLIRGYEGKYDGRNLYFDLDNNFDAVYDYIISIATQPKRVI